MTSAGWEASRGRIPRFFALDPTGVWLFEDSDTITTFKADRPTRMLSHRGEAARTGSPVCIVFRDAPQE
nr:beta-propeller fold lactonase family protein [Microvirga makkahensis]